jgi:hypothetical protein
MSSVYEKFIAANHALFACQEAVSVEQWNTMKPAEQDNVCKNEAQAVASFLKDDSVKFSNILNDRIANMQ